MAYPVDAEVGGPPLHDQINFNGQLFENKKIRHNFIKKVYSLLTIQLMLTAVVIALFALHPGVHAWARANRWFHLASFAVGFIILMAITCMGDLRRKHPHNLIALFAFTAAESLMLAAVTVMYDTKAILLAATMTGVICVSLTLFAMQTRYDFTAKLGIMIVVLMVAIFAMIIASFIPANSTTMLVMASIMAVIMGIFLVIDTQMIIGGTHQLQMSPEEYVFAAINLYLDIINMFLYILAIMGRDS